MTPDLGQGDGSSLEDAVVLGRHIGNSVIRNGGLIVQGDMAKAIDDYVKERRWRAACLDHRVVYIRVEAARRSKMVDEVLEGWSIL
jgi:2-polyprenyl-6-methoxyphenol hydroxylase-like FAD-dependent oxidoreductase